MIPAYNAEATLPCTLASVLHQKWRPIELIVVNDGSTDGTLAIADAFQRANNNTQFTVQVWTQINGGLSVSRRRGLELSRGEMLQFLDADDVLHPEKISRCMSEFRNECVDVVVPRTMRFREDWEIESRLMSEPELDPWPAKAITRSTVCSNLWHSAGPLFRRGIVERAGGFPRDVHSVIEELEFHGRVKLQRPHVVYLNEKLNFYRVGQKGSATGQIERVYRGRIEGARIVEEMFRTSGVWDRKEWRSLQMMALRTVFQIAYTLPKNEDLLRDAMDSLRLTLQDGSLIGSVFKMTSKRVSPSIVARIAPLVSSNIRQRFRRFGH